MGLWSRCSPVSVFVFFFSSTLYGLLGTGRTTQTKQNINLPFFPSLSFSVSWFVMWNTTTSTFYIEFQGISRTCFYVYTVCLSYYELLANISIMLQTNVALWKISLFCPYLSNKNNNKTLKLNFNLHSAIFWLVEEGVGEIPSQGSVVLQLYINSTRSVPETPASLCFFPRMPCSSPQQLQWAGVLVS